jgi:hypothetical protein
VLGTTTFYHLLTTMDYAGQALVLRRENSGFGPAGDRLPLWLAEQAGMAVDYFDYANMRIHIS